MVSKARGQIYTLPAGAAFLKSLARSLLDGEVCAPQDLGDVRVLLPTRRACRSLQEAFLDVRDGAAMLLPRLQPLGDVDEEELTLSLAGSLAGFGAGYDMDGGFPPEMSSLRRQMLLARLIKARPDFEQGFDRALELAKALGALMDQIYTENLALENLVDLVPDEFADHWQITLEFLKILSEAWPQILNEEGMIDAADRRNRLILALAEYWRENPPDVPVVVAGTTGSIPSTAILLQAVLAMPKGVIILPGLDQGMDDESWDALEEGHPQYGLKAVLQQLGVERGEVNVWPHVAVDDVVEKRHVLAREIMRPASTSGRWAELSQDASGQELLRAAFEDLSLYVCDSEREEAQVVSVLLREALEDQGAKACLVTPDRGLAARVASALRRWGIEVDDSAGSTLLRENLGGFILSVMSVCRGQARPTDVLALAQHPLMSLGLERGDYRAGLSALDQALRGARPAVGFEGLAAHIRAHERISDDVRAAALVFLDALEEVLRPLYELCHGEGYFSFGEVLRVHLAVCETLNMKVDAADGAALWSGADGQAASGFFAELLQQASMMSDVSVGEYIGALELFMKGVSVRSPYGVHPRVRILGQLEARMIDADVVVLGGLNEGVWPSDAGADPWMSRPMRKNFGLPGLERSIGLAGHDFVQGLCAGNVVITRSKRLGQAPSVPSRWLQRMDAVVQAAGLDGDAVLGGGAALQWVRGFEISESFAPSMRPAPKPPVAVRPRQLSVTKIETWLKDPYSIYAGYVLRLRPLEAVEKEVDAAVRGSLLHDTLERFVAEYPHDMPPNAAHILQGFARDVFKDYSDDEALWRFMWPRFEKVSHWYEAAEGAWRQKARPVKTEVEGRMNVQTVGGRFVLSARADRVDQVIGGGGAIIDYKSGGMFSMRALKGGELPQLPLEGLILAAGGFAGVKPMATEAFGYWVMSGASGVGKIVQVDEGAQGVMDVVRGGLQELVERFDDEDTPYLSLPRADYIPRFNDYLHLARVAEWAALDDALDEQEGEVSYG
jgi:ATP-dependent helicase/nuclease subunit B